LGKWIVNVPRTAVPVVDPRATPAITIPSATMKPTNATTLRVVRKALALIRPPPPSDRPMLLPPQGSCERDREQGPASDNKPESG